MKSPRCLSRMQSPEKRWARSVVGFIVFLVGLAIFVVEAFFKDREGGPNVWILSFGVALCSAGWAIVDPTRFQDFVKEWRNTLPVLNNVKPEELDDA